MPDGRSSSAPTLSDSVSANKRDPPPSRPSLPPHVIPPPAAHPTAPLNTNYTVRTSYKTEHRVLLQTRQLASVSAPEALEDEGRLLSAPRYS